MGDTFAGSNVPMAGEGAMTCDKPGQVRFFGTDEARKAAMLSPGNPGAPNGDGNIYTGPANELQNKMDAADRTKG